MNDTKPQALRRTRQASIRRAGRGRVLRTLAGIVLASLVAGASTALAAGTTAYTKRVTIPVPPASSYAGNSGGDGWALAFTPDAVYNVYHHGDLNVACHLQADASNCWDSPSKSITDRDGGQFYASNHPGLALHQPSGHLFVYATRVSDNSRGVVCIDTTQPASVSNPSCGYTRLSDAGDGAPGNQSPGNGVLVGTRFYSFNFVDGLGVIGSRNRLLCFDIAKEAACASQPFDLGYPQSTGVSNGYNPAAAIGGRVIVPIETDQGSWLACFNPATGTACSGVWPLALPGGNNFSGAPFPLLTSAGAVTGLCLPNGSGACYDFSGNPVVPPPGLAAAIGTTTGYNGPAQVIAARVYVLSGNDDAVHCYDYSTASACANFPHPLSGAGYNYTVNSDPQRPECLWTNADYGNAQIQNFDAFSGGACGRGAVRVLASSFVPPDVDCTPLSYTKLQVIDPARSGYASGTVAFRDASGNPINGAEDAALDASGSVNLAGVPLGGNGLPQFLITLDAPVDPVGAVTVEMTWTGQKLPKCSGSIATRLVANPSVAQLLPGAKLYLKLSAKLSDDSGAPLVGKSVNFTVGKRLVCTASTLATGVAACQGKPAAALGSVLTLGYTADFLGAGDYQPATARGPVLLIGKPK